MPAAMPFIKSGKLKPLGVTSEKRSLVLPNVPTIAESGLSGYSATTWYGLYAPKGTPVDIVQKIHDVTVEVIKTPEVREQMIQRGFEPIGNTPDQFAGFISSEITKWAKVVKIAVIEPE